MWRDVSSLQTTSDVHRTSWQRVVAYRTSWVARHQTVAAITVAAVSRIGRSLVSLQLLQVVALCACSRTCVPPQHRRSKLCRRRDLSRGNRRGEWRPAVCLNKCSTLSNQAMYYRLASFLNAGHWQLNQLHDNATHALLALLLRIFAARMHERNNHAWHKTTRACLLTLQLTLVWALYWAAKYS